jgi:copper(I)-binding protein
VGLLALLVAGCGGDDAGRAEAAPAPSGGSVTVDHVTIDFPPNPAVAAVRMQVHNGTAVEDELLSVTSPVAASSEMHRSMVDDVGQTSMEEIASLPVAARSTVTFEPAGLHVMLTGITADLQVGDEVPLVLTFADAGEVEATALVVEPGSVRLDEVDDVDEGDDTGGMDHEH